MSDERRYGEAETEEIFELAIRGEQALPLPTPGGLTLGELQSIGQQAGIDPELISEAARVLQVRGRPLPQRMSVGMPVSVGRVVSLPRSLSEHEWQTLVAELRDTFEATGTVVEQGSAREWSNGNLRVLLEPTTSGHQVRMSTTNIRLMRLNWYSMALLATALVFLVVLLPDLVADGVWNLRTLLGLLPTFVVAAAGAGALAHNRSTLSKWAEEREAQMSVIADRLRSLTSDAASEESPT